MKKIKVHIGKHKTGTTSFQKYLSDNSDILYYNRTVVVPRYLSRLVAAAVIREELPIPPLKALKNRGYDISLGKACAELADFFADSDADNVVFSEEHFSYFREQSEIDKFIWIIENSLLADKSQIKVYLVLRDRESFRISYRNQIIKAGHGESEDKNSPYYCKTDSWLLDDKAIINLWKNNFDEFFIIYYKKTDMVKILCQEMSIIASDKIQEYYFNTEKPRYEIIIRIILIKVFGVSFYQNARKFYQTSNRLLKKSKS